MSMERSLSIQIFTVNMIRKIFELSGVELYRVPGNISFFAISVCPCIFLSEAGELFLLLLVTLLPQ